MRPFTYTEQDWQRDTVAQQRSRLTCPACSHDEWYKAVAARRLDGSTRRYRACKVCGFWQEADGSPPYRCYMTVHICLAEIQPGEQCKYCGTWGPAVWHPNCWRVIPDAEVGQTRCDNCGVALSRDHIIPWAAEPHPS
jgi:hypothetical protein